MNPISRRNALRALVGTSGVVAGASALATPGLLDLATAAGSKKVRAVLSRTDYAPGQSMVLTIHHHPLRHGFELHVSDSKQLGWKRVPGSNNPPRWTATAHGSGRGTIRVKVLRPDGRVVHDPAYHDRVEYAVHGGMRGPMIGMHADPDVWAQRLREVGPGVHARRIYGDLASGSGSAIKLVEESHRAGMLPVVSYKVGGDVAGAINGRFNAAAKDAARQLASYDLPTAVVFWHEPYLDMSGAQYAAASRQILPHFKRGKLRVGPLLNGFLLDRQKDIFASFCPDDLFGLWDWVGVDSYQSGTAANPGDAMPASRIPALAKFVRSRGHGYLPLAVGEYNGWSAKAIADTGNALLSTPNMWFGCVWNNTERKGQTLTGDRLRAFQQTLADPRNKRPRNASTRGAVAHIAGPASAEPS